MSAATATEHGGNTEHGNGDVARAGEILRTVVGSGVHGIAIAGTDDHDEMGVFIEPADRVLGLAPAVPHYVFRTRPEGARSGPGDVDLVMYFLRKYLRLATKGNPTALLPLFAPPESVLLSTPMGDELRALAPAVLSQEAARRFVAMRKRSSMTSQRDRLLGRRRRSAVPNRPELVARYGSDVKYASHALRLVLQGREIVRDARLTLPMPEPERAEVPAVKRGDVPVLADVLSRIADVRADIEQRLAVGRTPLPAEPDVAAVTAWAVDAQRRHWNRA